MREFVTEVKGRWISGGTRTYRRFREIVYECFVHLFRIAFDIRDNLIHIEQNSSQ
jgi:hypothetical protein